MTRTLVSFVRIILLSFMIMAVAATPVDWSSAKIPTLARVNGPVLMQVISEKWSEQLFQASVWFAQVEKESCVSLTSKKCWSSTVEFKTSREYGFGLGQITRTAKFNKFAELKQEFIELKYWEYVDRFNAERQLLAMVSINRSAQQKVEKLVPADNDNHTAFTLVSYNSGFGGFLQDRKLCMSVANCDSTRWFDNIEKNSFKSRVKIKGYGASYFEISRKYPRDIMFVRRDKYRFVD